MEGFKNLVPQYALVRRNGGEKITVTIQITITVAIIILTRHYNGTNMQWFPYTLVCRKVILTFYSSNDVLVINDLDTKSQLIVAHIIFRHLQSDENF